MATITFILLAAVCIAAQAFPQNPLPYKNTIFGDEKLKGEPFENIDDFSILTQLSRSDGNSPYRLPTTTKPTHYNLLWMIEIPENVFSGEVQILLHATQVDVNEVVIHAQDLNIESVTLRLGNSEVPVTFSLEPEYDFLRVHLTDTTLAYSMTTNVIYSLSIAFNAPLRNDMAGLYQHWFRNSASDAVNWMASSQFAATSARFAFPCYDEPSFKATFSVTVRRPTASRSWSGMRLQQTVTTNITGYEDDVFYISPTMSTYLLAIIVADYSSITLYEGENLMYEVIARPGAIESDQGSYAFQVGQDLLAAMSDYTALDFYDVHPYVKMTHAALPDFSDGAMENWGLLTYREAYLMYDEQHTNSHSKQIIAYIISHEIVHMWFGNLVTCDWWDALWLNEGFARYYQYYLTEWVEPEMGLGSRFINEQVHTSMLTDSADNPHPLTNPGIADPVQVRSMFSAISYNKGAAIIRQTDHLLGFTVHRDGLRRYLNSRSFNTALPTHLFQALQNEAVATGSIAQYGEGFNVIDYYRTWTEQPGHPVLNVQVDHQTGQMIIYQRRFNINSGYSTTNTNWIVPITFATASNPDFQDTKPSHIIRDAITVINRNSIGDEWVIFNKQQTGFYRVNYDDYTWNLIVMALRGLSRTQIHEHNRAQIINDVFQFARSGIMNYYRAFNIISFLENETEYTPWVAAITGFNWIRNRLVGSSYLDRLDEMIVRWATAVMNHLTYYPIPNESFMQSYLRYQLAPFMCNLNQLGCREIAVLQFQALRQSGTEVPVDSRNWVYCNALRQGTEEDFEFLWERFLNHNVYTEKILLLQSLGCTPHESSLIKLLDAIIEDNFIVRPQDYTAAFSAAVNGNEGNTQIVLRYIQRNVTAVALAFGSTLTPINYVTPLSYISSRLRNILQIEEYENWVVANREEFGTSYNSIYSGIESTRQSLQWAADVQNDIEYYLNEGDETYQTSTSAPVVPEEPVTVTAPQLVEPTTPELPVVETDEPTTVIDELISTDEPTTTDEPTVTDDPAVTNDSAITDDSAVTDEPSSDATTPLIETTTPESDSANTAFLSMFIITIAIILNVTL
ncbi:membrane alanyl aminopeptidase-like [Ostrinia nubilalis]|uniref:membrane alanyl aminopeptidase-like n=1 Tax=Ostrinia nubilalis TaxID=29057 RepID=UPI0030825508